MLKPPFWKPRSQSSHLCSGTFSLDAIEHHFIQRHAHAGDGHIAILTVRNDLADHGVVIGRHAVAVINVGLCANARPAGRMKSFNEPW